MFLDLCDDLIGGRLDLFQLSDKRWSKDVAAFFRGFGLHLVVLAVIVTVSQL